MDHLKTIILNYIEKPSSNHYALLIDGKWGSGKTYYLKNILKEKIEEVTDFKVLYTSLNGVESTSEIAEQVFFESILPVESKNQKTEKKKFKQSLTKFLRTSATITGRWFKVTPEDFQRFGLEDFTDLKKTLFVFDDLERLSPKLNTVDVLGFINRRFIESNQFKVLIIGNEAEIETNQKDNYLKSKEKVIGRTLTYLPNISKIVNNYINSINTFEEYQRFLKSHQIFLLKLILSIKVNNLRTLFFFFDSLKEIFEGIEIDMPDELGQKLITSALIYSIEYKEGNFELFKIIISNNNRGAFLEGINYSDFEKKEEKEEGINVFKDKYFEYRNHILYLTSLYDFLDTGYLDKKKLKSDLKILLPEEVLPEVNALIKVSDFKLENLTDSEFKFYITIILDALEKNKYNLLTFTDAIKKINHLLARDLISFEDLSTTKAEYKDFLLNNLEQIKSNFIPFDEIKTKLNELDLSFLKNYPTLKTAILAQVEEHINDIDNTYIEAEFEKYVKIKDAISISESPVNLHFLISGFIYLKPEKFSELISYFIDNNSLLLIPLKNAFIAAYLQKNREIKQTRNFSKDNKNLIAIHQHIVNKLKDEKFDNRSLTRIRSQELLEVIEEAIKIAKE